MKNNLLLSTFFLTLFLQSFTSNVFSQSASADYYLILQNEERWVPENLENFLKNDDVQSDEIFEGKYHRIVQFFQIPTNREKAELENLGIEFLDYFPNKAYIVSIPVSLDKADLKNKNILFAGCTSRHDNYLINNHVRSTTVWEDKEFQEKFKSKAPLRLYEGTIKKIFK